MKRMIFSSLFLLCIILCGCSTSTKQTISGRDIDGTKVNQIQKGVTTADGVVKLCGEPDTKEIVSENQVMWHYAYLNELYSDHNMLTTVVEQTTGFKKNLDILFQDDTVINVSYLKVPIQSEKIH